jgi:hypothetical protein
VRSNLENYLDFWWLVGWLVGVVDNHGQLGEGLGVNQTATPLQRTGIDLAQVAPASPPYLCGLQTDGTDFALSNSQSEFEKLTRVAPPNRLRSLLGRSFVCLACRRDEASRVQMVRLTSLISRLSVVRRGAIVSGSGSHQRR